MKSGLYKKILCWPCQLAFGANRNKVYPLRNLSTRMETKVITFDNMNPQVKKMEYAVRGPLVIRAAAIEKEIEAGVVKPFKEVTRANIGDAHAMGQKPITFLRQVVAMCLFPSLMEDATIPEDAKQRARVVLQGCSGGSLGSYSPSAGIETIRHHVADYISARDGHPSNWENIVLCAGASEGIRGILKLLVHNNGTERFGVLVPIPQYPLYSATVVEFDLHQCNYYLDESHEWGLDIQELQRAVDEGKKNCLPKALVVINPGNPTGQVLSKENIQKVIKFAYRNNLFLLADEIIKMECQIKKNEHFGHFLLFAFNQGSKAAKPTHYICAVNGEGPIAARTACDWYAKLENGNFDLKDAPHSGCPFEFDEND